MLTGDTIRKIKACKTQGMSQSQTARALNISRPTIAKYWSDSHIETTDTEELDLKNIHEDDVIELTWVQVKELIEKVKAHAVEDFKAICISKGCPLTQGKNKIEMSNPEEYLQDGP